MLILSILALFAGPLLYHWLRKGGLIARAVDRVIVAALVLMLVFILVPEVVAGLGYWALLLIAAGYLVPGLLEAAVQSAARTFHYISMTLAALGLVMHAMLDGAGLAGSHASTSESLGLAIILHRFGVGLILWLIVEPAFGRKAAFAVLSLVAMSTLAGYYLSSELGDLQHGSLLLTIQALIAGTIIHSLVHRSHVHTDGSHAH